jgi:hypothetical protein
VGVGLIFGHTPGIGEPFDATLGLDVLVSNAARKVEIEPVAYRKDGYFRFSVFLPDGTTLSVHGNERWGYSAALYDEDGRYLGSCSKAEAERRREEREGYR